VIGSPEISEAMLGLMAPTEVLRALKHAAAEGNISVLLVLLKAHLKHATQAWTMCSCGDRLYEDAMRGQKGSHLLSSYVHCLEEAIG
jgi:1,4-dihydroxy-2-naphthoyl-CoA synthase